MLKAENQPVLCVDIGGTSTKAGILDTSGVLHSTDSIPTKPDAESYFGNLLRLIQQIRGNERSLTQLGVAVAGFL
ncbi:MAG: ROK family protein, partial [Acidobacteriaceae bacterium]|nr:ROK family protein [Acidobacteriaceae bacterium]